MLKRLTYSLLPVDVNFKRAGRFIMFITARIAKETNPVFLLHFFFSRPDFKAISTIDSLIEK
jgi:hypothetical protein